MGNSALFIKFNYFFKMNMKSNVLFLISFCVVVYTQQAYILSYYDSKLGNVKHQISIYNGGAEFGPVADEENRRVIWTTQTRIYYYDINYEETQVAFYDDLGTDILTKASYVTAQTLNPVC